MSRDYSNKITLRPAPGSVPFPVSPINIVLVAVDPNGTQAGSAGDLALLAGGTGMWRCLGGSAWAVVGSGGGVVGPGVSTPDALVRWDGITGAMVADSNVLLSGMGSMTFPPGAAVTVDAVEGTTPSAGVLLAGVRHYPNAAVDPFLPLPNDGDLYYNLGLQMQMQYDGIRGKWLSVTSQEFVFGRNGNTPSEVYYHTADDRVMSSMLGWYTIHPGTVVALGYTRSNTSMATFEVQANGLPIAATPSVASGGLDTLLDADFTAGSVLAVRSQAGSSITSNVIAYLVVRWRS